MGNRHGGEKASKEEKEEKRKKKKEKKARKKGRKKLADGSDVDLDPESSHFSRADSESMVFHSAENLSPYLDASTRSEEGAVFAGVHDNGHVLSSRDFHDGFSIEACLPADLAAASDVSGDVTKSGDDVTSMASGSYSTPLLSSPDVRRGIPRSPLAQRQKDSFLEPVPPIPSDFSSSASYQDGLSSSGGTERSSSRTSSSTLDTNAAHCIERLEELERNIERTFIEKFADFDKNTCPAYPEKDKFDKNVSPLLQRRREKEEAGERSREGSITPRGMSSAGLPCRSLENSPAPVRKISEPCRPLHREGSVTPKGIIQGVWSQSAENSPIIVRKALPESPVIVRRTPSQSPSVERKFPANAPESPVLLRRVGTGDGAAASPNLSPNIPRRVLGAAPTTTTTTGPQELSPRFPRKLPDIVDGCGAGVKKSPVPPPVPPKPCKTLASPELARRVQHMPKSPVMPRKVYHFQDQHHHHHQQARETGCWPGWGDRDRDHDPFDRGRRDNQMPPRSPSRSPEVRHRAMRKTPSSSPSPRLGRKLVPGEDRAPPPAPLTPSHPTQIQFCQQAKGTPVKRCIVATQPSTAVVLPSRLSQDSLESSNGEAATAGPSHRKTGGPTHSEGPHQRLASKPSKEPKAKDAQPAKDTALAGDSHATKDSHISKDSSTSKDSQTRGKTAGGATTAAAVAAVSEATIKQSTESAVFGSVSPKLKRQKKISTAEGKHEQGSLDSQRTDSSFDSSTRSPPYSPKTERGGPKTSVNTITYKGSVAGTVCVSSDTTPEQSPGTRRQQFGAKQSSWGSRDEGTISADIAGGLTFHTHLPFEASAEAEGEREMSAVYARIYKERGEGGGAYKKPTPPLHRKFMEGSTVYHYDPGAERTMHVSSKTMRLLPAEEGEIPHRAFTGGATVERNAAGRGRHAGGEHISPHTAGPHVRARGGRESERTYQAAAESVPKPPPPSQPPDSSRLGRNLGERIREVIHESAFREVFTAELSSSSFERDDGNLASDDDSVFGHSSHGQEWGAPRPFPAGNFRREDECGVDRYLSDSSCASPQVKRAKPAAKEYNSGPELGEDRQAPRPSLPYPCDSATHAGQFVLTPLQDNVAGFPLHPTTAALQENVPGFPLHTTTAALQGNVASFPLHTTTAALQENVAGLPLHTTTAALQENVAGFPPPNTTAIRRIDVDVNVTLPQAQYRAEAISKPSPALLASSSLAGSEGSKLTQYVAGQTPDMTVATALETDPHHPHSSSATTRGVETTQGTGKTRSRAKEAEAQRARGRPIKPTGAGKTEALQQQQQQQQQQRLHAAMETDASKALATEGKEAATEERSKGDNALAASLHSSHLPPRSSPSPSPSSSSCSSLRTVVAAPRKKGTTELAPLGGEGATDARKGEDGSGFREETLQKTGPDSTSVAADAKRSTSGDNKVSNQSVAASVQPALPPSAADVSKTSPQDTVAEKLSETNTAQAGSEKNTDSSQAENVAQKSDECQESEPPPSEHVPPPSPTAMDMLAEEDEEEEEDVEGLVTAHQYPDISSRISQEMKLFGENVVKRLSNLLDSQQSESDSCLDEAKTDLLQSMAKPIKPTALDTETEGSTQAAEKTPASPPNAHEESVALTPDGAVVSASVPPSAAVSSGDTAEPKQKSAAQPSTEETAKRESKDLSQEDAARPPKPPKEEIVPVLHEELNTFSTADLPGERLVTSDTTETLSTDHETSASSKRESTTSTATDETLTSFKTRSTTDSAEFEDTFVLPESLVFVRSVDEEKEEGEGEGGEGAVVEAGRIVKRPSIPSELKGKASPGAAPGDSPPLKPRKKRRRQVGSYDVGTKADVTEPVPKRGSKQISDVIDAYCDDSSSSDNSSSSNSSDDSDISSSTDDVIREGPVQKIIFSRAEHAAPPPPPPKASETAKKRKPPADRSTDSSDDNVARRRRSSSSTTSSQESASFRIPEIEETFGELMGVKTFLEDMEDQTPTADRPPVFLGPEDVKPKEFWSASHYRRSRTSPAKTDRTESDLDISEQRDDASTDSMYADDEDESGELLFQRSYSEEHGGEVLLSCTIYNSSHDKDGDSDEFWADAESGEAAAAAEEKYRELEASADAAGSAFQNARHQMQDIHQHLQDLRRQMELLQDDITSTSLTMTPDFSLESEQRPLTE